MKVNINSVHFKVDKKLVQFIEQKVDKLSQYYDDIISSDVSLKVSNKSDRENKIAEIRVNIKGSDLFAKKQCDTFEEATDQAVDALKRQITKHKAKVRKKY
ncbi:MAG: ribosome-associated translation inhibitor RaiA [Bacteroidales bacterium]|jgi:putative sigma-54 modulation protein|nr:ribosome-associated translation inhibitor RaiA [Bacteroidales bacterium]